LFFSKEKSLSIWGPKFAGYEQVVKEKSLIEVCGVQWQRCLQKSREVFEKRIAPERYIRVKYEDFVKDPVAQSSRIFDYFSLSHDKHALQEVCKTVRQDSVGKWQKDLSAEQKSLLSELLKEELKNSGYLE